MCPAESQSSPAKPSGAAQELRGLLSSAVAESTAEGILLSGGLDTSIVATLAAEQGRRLRAYTLCVADAPAPDEPFALQMAERLGLEHKILRPTIEELIGHMPEAVERLTTFDPMELTNSVVTWLGMQAVGDAGVKAVLTGDAADELFAGYSFLFNAPADDLPFHIRHMNKIMRFTSEPLGASLDIKAWLPFASQPVRDFALTMTAAELVGEYDGKRYGKKILRQAFADVLPPEITWRLKTPIEHGSGSTAMRQALTERMSDEEFLRAQARSLEEDGVRLRDKQQCFYYQHYRSFFPPPRELPRQAKTCPECQGPVARTEMRFCRICGAYPV